MLSPYSYDEKTRGSSGNYNGGNASRYALDHALNPSSDYTYFSKDCTNFISQCLYAGGIKQHVGTVYSDTCWFYKTSTIDRHHGPVLMNFIDMLTLEFQR